jgi:hypothetical protein
MQVFCADIYRLMLSDKKYGLSVNLMATRVMPSLLPQTVNPSLNLEQFTNLLEVLQEMLDHIDRYVNVALDQELRPSAWVSATGTTVRMCTSVFEPYSFIHSFIHSVV